ncbi:BTAD domain-containing putative transcriptional regulator [Modestobacter roseus]|uniref:BTAD domain-containing putative transcriptional regulator n=1 Tax=Modestobacter roseus TaxID=1181884 RepID=UPI00141280D0|nr:BTAD domain-containing putative transcriptional regulator [Modestobacter roseus]
MRFRVLGPLEVADDDGHLVDVGAAKPRALLTLLLAEPGRVVPVDRIVAALWGDEPPATATATLQTYVAQLRRLLEPGRAPREPPRVLLTRPPGYLLDAAPADVDLTCFTDLVDRGDRAVAAGDPGGGVQLLDRALALWRGAPLAELTDSPSSVTERQRLTELRVRARERRCDALVAVGRPEAAVADLQQLVADHPLRERLWARLVAALYLADRQADALAAVRRCAGLLRAELGIDPGPELRDLERAVLRHDPALQSRVPRPELPAPHVAHPPPEEETLVGRAAELSRLETLLGQVAAGRPAVALVEGEAGIGKTRLAEAVADRARRRGWPVAWSRCADEPGAPALWPWTQALDQLDQPELSPAGAEEADADAARFRLFQELRTRLVAATGAPRSTPVVVVLDDVQAADTTTLVLLGLLVRHLPRSPLLLVLTVRTTGELLPAAVEQLLSRLGREPALTRLVLGGLGTDDVGALLTAQLGTASDRELATAVHDRTGGNPYFVVELSRWMGGHGRRLDRVPVPPSVRDVLRTRLARLPDSTEEVLQFAAVIGREAPLDLLEAAGPATDQVLTAMDTAVAMGLVVPGDAPWSWRFTHALVQEVVVGDLTPVLRAWLHARVAAALERQRAGVTGPAAAALAERLARHHVEAVPVTGPDPAIRASVAAADAARARLAHDEAAGHTRRALDLLVTDRPETPGRRLDLLITLGDDLLRSGHLLDAQSVVAEAISCARELGDRRRLGEAAAVWGGVTLWNWRPHGVVDAEMVAVLEELLADEPSAERSTLDDDRRRARLLGTLGVELAFSEDLERGPRSAGHAVALARRLDDPELLGRTLNNYGLAVWGRPGAAELRLAAADEALALAGRGLPRRTEFFARLHRAAIRLHLGDRAGFEADQGAGRRLALSLSGPEVRPQVLWQAAGAAWLRGDTPAADELTREAYELFRVVTPHARHAWAAHQFTLRRPEGRLDTVLDLLVETGDEGSPLLREMAVIAAAESGAPDEARRLRRRWGRSAVRDWASDVVVLLEGESALLLDDPRAWEAALTALAPFRGRQAVLGTPAFSLGSYDELMGRLVERCGDLPAAVESWRAAARQGRAVGSPWQVSTAERHLARVGARSGPAAV